MYWKVYNIQTGQTLKSGFKKEKAAKEWLEKHRPGREENYLAEEMDEDEMEEWIAANPGKEEPDLNKDAEEEDDYEEGRYTYSTDDDDDYTDDEELLNEVDDDDD